MITVSTSPAPVEKGKELDYEEGSFMQIEIIDENHEPQDRYPNMAEKFAQAERRTELLALERVVIEAVIADRLASLEWAHGNLPDNAIIDRMIQTRNAAVSAVDALIEARKTIASSSTSTVDSHA